MARQIPFLRSRGKGGVACAILLTLFCSATVRAEVFLEVAFGGALAHPTDIRVDGPDRSLRYSDVDVETRSFASPPHYMIRLGYFLPGRPEVGFSLAMVHLKYFPRLDDVSAEGAQLGEVFDRFSITHGYNHFPLEVSLRLPVHERFAPFVSFGPSLLLLHPEVQYRGEELRQQYMFGGFGLNATIGARYYFTPWLGLVSEYRFTGSNGGFELDANRYSVTERSHHFHLGVTARPPGEDVF